MTLTGLLRLCNPSVILSLPAASLYCASTTHPCTPLLLLSQVGIQQGLLTGLSLGSLNMVLFSAYAASLYYGATRVAAGAMSGGDVLAVMMAALLGAYSLGQAAPLLQYFLAGRAAAGRLTAVDKIQPSIDVDAPGQQLGDVAGELRLQDVSFVYPCLQVQVLHGLNLHIPAGETGCHRRCGACMHVCMHACVCARIADRCDRLRQNRHAQQL
jgi:ABC-type multidrug transport system fused ATPase/permease subunit